MTGQRELKPFSGDSSRANNTSSSSHEQLGHLRLRRLFQPKATRRREPSQGSPSPSVKTPRSSRVLPAQRIPKQRGGSDTWGQPGSDSPSALREAAPAPGAPRGRRDRTTARGRGGAEAQLVAQAGLREGKRLFHNVHCEVLSSYTIPKKLRGNIKASVKCNSCQG